MKRYTSVAGLAVRASWVRAVGVFFWVGLVQWFMAMHQMAPGGSLIQTGVGLEMLVREGMAFWGSLGLPALMVALMGAGDESKRVRSGYTLRRLGIREMDVTMVWGLVNAGWFLLYWVFQIGMILVVYRYFVTPTNPGPNALFLAAWRSEYFHQLLPMEEWIGYVRNIVICLGLGFGAACGAHQLRHKRSAFVSVMLLPVLVFAAKKPGQMAADVTVIVLIAAITVGYWFLVRGGDHNEEAI